MKTAYTILIIAAFVLMHLLLGGGDGTRLIYVLPSYVIVGLAGVLTLISFPREKCRMDRNCLVSTAALSLYLFVRIALSPAQFLAQVESFALLGSLLVYFITARFITETRHRVAIVIFLLVMAVGQVAVGVFQFAKDSNLHPLIPGGRGDMSQRASGFFISPNHLAGFLEVVIIFGTSLFFWGGFRAWVRVLIAYFTLVCLAGLVLTGSRGGYLSTIIGVGVFATLSVWSARSAMSRLALPRVLGLVVALSLSGVVIAIATERSYMLRARSSTVFVSEDIRLQLWDAAWKQFKLAPVFGTGSRSYFYHGRTFRAPQVQSDPVFAHSDYLQTLAEYGVVGLGLFVAFIAAHLVRARHAWLRLIKTISNRRPHTADRQAMALQLGCMGSIAAYLAHSVTDFNLHIPANALLLAFVFGMLASRRVRPEDGPEGLWDRLPRLIPAGLGAWMLAAGIPRIPAELFIENSRSKLVTGDLEGSLRAADQALKRGTHNPLLFYQIGEARRLMAGQLRTPQARVASIEAARKAYADGMALFPQDVRLVLVAAWTLDKLDRISEAEALYARAIELDPNSGLVWAYYAWHCDQIGNIAEALAHARRATELGCNVTLSLRVMGEAFDLRDLEKRAAAIKSPG